MHVLGFDYFDNGSCTKILLDKGTINSRSLPILGQQKDVPSHIETVLSLVMEDIKIDTNL